MVAPVSGPFEKFIEVPKVYHHWHSWYRQRKPYTLPLPRTRQQGWLYQAASHVSSAKPSAIAGMAYSVAEVNQKPKAYAQAYEDLQNRLGDTASLGVTLAQWKQADRMIASRASQLTRFTVALARRSPLGVAAALGIRASEVKSILRTRYGVSRKLSDLWLEFWFGWKPLVQDIYTACEVFDRPLPFAHFKGKGRSETPWYDYHVDEAAELRFRAKEKLSLTIGADIRLGNPNVRLLQEFGLINPAQVVFETIPWSFVLGWVSNVNLWLSSFTTFAGLEIRDAYIATRAELDWEESWPDYRNEVKLSCRGFGLHEDRKVLPTIPRPQLLFGSQVLRPTRALTSISLLVQKLPRS